MTKPAVVMWMLVMFGLRAGGQIQAPLTGGAGFSISPPQLRPLPSAPESARPRVAAGSDPASMAAEATHAARSRDLELVERFDRAIVSNRPARLSTEGPDRWFRDVFEPEVFQLGHMTVGSSLATAIKRRNPLCLLNPYVFWATF